MTDDKTILDGLHFLATKYETRDTWFYSRNTGDLEHIRYKSDHTGYEHWTKRVGRAFNWKKLTGRDRLSRELGFGRYDSFKDRLLGTWARILITLRKDKNLPDGSVMHNLTFWEEDGQYIGLMAPVVGEKVVKFLTDYPEHPGAQEIMAELRESWKRNFKGDN